MTQPDHVDGLVAANPGAWFGWLRGNLTAQPLSYRFFAATIVFSLLVTAVVVTVQLFTAWRDDVRRIDERLDQIGVSHGPTLASAAWNMDTAQIGQVLDGVLSLPDIAFAQVRLEHGETHARGERIPAHELSARSFELRQGGGQTHLGQFLVVASNLGVRERIGDRAWGIVSGSVISIFLVALFVLGLFQLWINRHLRSIARYAQQLGPARLDRPLQLQRRQRDDELQRVVDAINQMRLALQADLQLRARVEAELADHRDRLEEIVGQRTAQLETAKEAADNALQQLQSAQRVLVESEKMASLGQLVAGVAHEINTPLGVAVTASSHLLELVHVLQRQFDDGSLTREQLRDQLAQSAEAGEILVRNLERGAQLVQSFKQVSVDRSFDGHRSFDLREHLTQLVASLRPLWRQRPITVTIECPQDLVLDSFPGALGQVLTNLMQNALLHAFDERDGGRIEIHAHAASADDVEISVSDNGKGVDDSVRERMFEPFVTTRRQHGGTGLGLHIVYNLVVHKLRGSLRVDSSAGSGCRLTLRVPRRAA